MENLEICEIGGDEMENLKIRDIGGDEMEDIGVDGLMDLKHKRKSSEEEEEDIGDGLMDLKHKRKSSDEEEETDEEGKKKQKSDEDDDDDSFDSSENDESDDTEEEEEEKEEEDTSNKGGDFKDDDEDSRSYFTDEQVMGTEVKPEEYEVELDEEEKIFYTSSESCIGPYYMTKKVEKGSFKYHFATKEELKQLVIAVRKSEGFDIPLLPGAVHGNTIRCNLSIKEYAVYIAMTAKCALIYYNKRYGTNYVLQRLVKSNATPCNLIIYLITFKATSADNGGHTKTFQAKVRVHFTGRLHVMICRIKKDDDQPQLKEGSSNSDDGRIPIELELLPSQSKSAI